jgi:hypothetical protein
VQYFFRFFEYLKKTKKSVDTQVAFLIYLMRVKKLLKVATASRRCWQEKAARRRFYLIKGDLQ